MRGHASHAGVLGLGKGTMDAQLGEQKSIYAVRDDHCIVLAWMHIAQYCVKQA